MCVPFSSPAGRKLSCSLLLLVAFFLTSKSQAQTVTGNITGTVTDPSGAIISGASVTATNTGTGIQTQATTNDAGVYTLRFLPIGQYQVTIAAPTVSSPRSIRRFSLRSTRPSRSTASFRSAQPRRP